MASINASTTIDKISEQASAYIRVEEKTLTLNEAIEREAVVRDLDHSLAKKIAFCESTNRQFDKKTGETLRGKKNPNDVGLYQINEKFHLERSKALGYDIYTLEGNVGYALWLMEREGYRHWNSSRSCWG